MKRGREGRVEGGGDERENGKSGWRGDEGWKRGERGKKVETKVIEGTGITKGWRGKEKGRDEEVERREG